MTCGASFFIKATQPDVLPSRVPRFFFQSKFCLAKKLFTISRTSTAFVVSKRGSQNRDKNQEQAALRDVSTFIQLHAEGKWRSRQFFHDLLQNIRRHVSDSGVDDVI